MHKVSEPLEKRRKKEWERGRQQEKQYTYAYMHV